jgi:hypothetical protein
MMSMPTVPPAVTPQVHCAADVPRLRDKMLHGWRSGFLHTMLSMTDAQLFFPYREVAGTRRPLSVGEWGDRLIGVLSDVDLPLYYVTRDMTGLVSQAAQAMPYYRVHEDQLPSRTGLVVFGDPVCEVPPERLREGQRVMINAALWLPSPMVNPEGQPGVMVVTLQDGDVLAATQPVDYGNRHWRDAIAQTRQIMGPLGYHEEYPLPYGDAPYGVKDQRVRNTAVAAMICTWTLMGQRITVTSNETLPRSLRRQYTRDGRPEPLVRTTTLRQSAHTHQDPQERDPDAPGRVYTKRWVVGEYAYWRNTWYPSKERHEQQLVLVPSYIKGPKGAPLVGGDRVSVLRR